MTNQTNTNVDRHVPELSGSGTSQLDLGIPITLSWGWATDTGRRRQRNEDSVLADRTLFLVADGMGGHSRGDVASQLVVQHMASLVGRTEVDPDACAAILKHAADAVGEIESGASGAAGTTLTGAIATNQGGGPYWLFLNIGDSRTYLFRNGDLVQITVDHSAVAELVARGEITAEQARTHPERNVITRAIGAGQDCDTDLWMVPLHPGDAVLVASDGVTNELTDPDLVELLAAASGPGSAASTVVRAAVESGGRDNASAVVVAVAGQPLPEYSTTVEDLAAASTGHSHNSKETS